MGIVTVAARSTSWCAVVCTMCCGGGDNCNDLVCTNCYHYSNSIINILFKYMISLLSNRQYYSIDV